MPIDIISLTEFKNDASGWIERLQSQPPVVLTQNGRGRAVVQSYESYQQLRNEMAMMQIAARADADIRAGRSVPHDQVMAEAFALIDSIEKAQAPSKPKKTKTSAQKRA